MALSEEAQKLKSDLMAIAEGYVGCDTNVQKKLIHEFLDCMNEYEDNASYAIYELLEDEDVQND